MCSPFGEITGRYVDEPGQPLASGPLPHHQVLSVRSASHPASPLRTDHQVPGTCSPSTYSPWSST